MNNKTLFSIVILLSYALMAAPVDLNKAQRVAGNIFSERSNTGNLDDFNLRSVDVLDENFVSKSIFYQNLYQNQYFPCIII